VIFFIIRMPETFIDINALFQLENLTLVRNQRFDFPNNIAGFFLQSSFPSNLKICHFAIEKL